MYIIEEVGFAICPSNTPNFDMFVDSSCHDLIRCTIGPADSPYTVLVCLVHGLCDCVL